MHILYEGHSLCLAIWSFNSTYSRSIYSSFLKKPPPPPPPPLLSLYTFDHPLKPAVCDTRPRWLGYVKNDALYECSGIFGVLKLLSLQLRFNGWDQKQVTGANSGEYGGSVTSWTSLAARKSRVTAAVCAMALSWWSSRPRTPVLERRLHHAWKTLGKQRLTYQSAVTVFLPSSCMVATWPNFAKKQAIICLEALLFLLNFTGGFSSGKTHTADCCFVSGSYWYTQVSSTFTMSQMCGDLHPSNFLST